MICLFYRLVSICILRTLLLQPISTDCFMYQYFTPNGNYINGVGIDPDFELEYEYLNPDGTEYDVKYDNQIQKAVEVLTEELSGK